MSQNKTISFPKQLSLIPHDVDGKHIHQRAKDGYINATEMCQTENKLFGDYRKLQATKEFLTELYYDTGIPISELIQMVKGKNPKLQGTWVHPKVAINLGQWISPKFAVWIIRHIVLKNLSCKLQPEMPKYIYQTKMPE